MLMVVWLLIISCYGVFFSGLVDWFGNDVVVVRFDDC